MIPYLVDKNMSAIPANNGLGILAETTYCRARHELNGEDEIELRYPIDGALFDKLELRAVIMAKVDRTRGVQPYRIYRITKPINGIVTVYARHLAYDLAGIVVEPYTASTITAALSGLSSHAMTTNPFTFSTTRTTTATFKVTVPTSIWNLMGGQRGSLLDVYGGEYTFDGYTVRLENHIGADNGVSVRYGVNMTDLEQDANCADCYTGVVAYWQSAEGDNVVYSPVVSAAGTYGYVKILSVDMSSKWEEQPTAAQLSAAASAYITDNQIGIPKVSWKIGFVPLDQTEEYKNIAVLERVSLGDTVTVKFAKLGVDASARVNAIDWNVLLERYNCVELGDVRANIADTIARQTQEITKVPAVVENLAVRITKTITNAILGADGGSVRLLDTNNDGEPDTLYIADNPDPAQAVKVWRFNYQGWGASTNGYNGPFTMGATLNGGLMADFITAGTLNANNILVQSSGDVGQGFGDCTVQLNGQFIDGIQESSTKTLWRLGTVVKIVDGSYIANGDLKLFARGSGIDDTKPVIWVGGEDGGFGISMRDPYTGYNAKANLIYFPDFGFVFQIVDDSNTVVASIDQLGRVDCKSLYINGQQVTP